MRNTVLQPAATIRCAGGAKCASYPTLGEPSKLSRSNPGPWCFACEKKRGDYFMAEAVAKRATTERAGTAVVGHQHAEVSRALASLERRKASVLTCKRLLQSAIVSEDARLVRIWSTSLGDAEARLRGSERDLKAREKRT